MNESNEALDLKHVVIVDNSERPAIRGRNLVNPVTVIERTSNGELLIRVDDYGDPEFWLSIVLSPEQVKLLMGQQN